MLVDALNEAINFETDANIEIERLALDALGGVPADITDKIMAGQTSLLALKKQLEDLRQKSEDAKRRGESLAEIERAQSRLDQEVRKASAAIDALKSQRSEILRQRSDEISRIQQEIERYYTRDLVGSAPARKKRRITKSDVVAFELSKKIARPAIYYYKLSEQKFVEVVTDQMGAQQDEIDEEEADLTPEEQESADVQEQEQEEQDQQKEKADEDDDEAPAQSEDEKEAAKALGHTEERALRKTRNAIINKTVTMSNGDVRTVPMTPIARYYHLLPPAALADHIKRVWLDKGSTSLNRAIDSGVTGANLRKAVESSLNEFFDKLRIESCLIDTEINQIQDSFLKRITQAGDLPADELKGALKGAMNEAIEDTILRGVVIDAKGTLKRVSRGGSSKLLGYIRREDEAVVKPDDLITIYSANPAAGKAGISLDQIGKIGRKFEEMMTARFVSVQQTHELRQELGIRTAGETRSVSALLSGAESDAVRASAAAAIGAKEFAPHTARGIAHDGREEEESMINAVTASTRPVSPRRAQIAAARQEAQKSEEVREEEGTLTGSLLLDTLVPIRVTVRKGETPQTLHNRISDEQQVVDKIQKPIKQAPTSPKRILQEVRMVSARINSVKADISRLAVGLDTSKQRIEDLGQILADCRSMRDEIEYLSGLLEYFYFAAEPLATELQTGASKTLARVIAKSTELHSAALSMTDDIVRMVHMRKGKSSRDAINLLMSDNRARQQRADQQGEELEIILLRQQYAALESELRQIEGKDDRVIAERMIEQVNNAEIDRLLLTCDEIVKTLKAPEQDSGIAVALAATRKGRIQKIERAQSQGWSSKSSAQRRVTSAEEIYERAVSGTVGFLHRNNKMQMHSLQMNDSIKSLASDYALAQVAGTVEKNATFTAQLPKKYTGQEVPRPVTYTVEGVDGVGANAKLTVVGMDENGGRLKFSIPRDEVLRHTLGNASRSPADLRKHFADLLRFSAAAALRSVSRELVDSADLIAPEDDDKSLVGKMAEVLFKGDQIGCQEERKAGIRSLKETFVGAGLKDLAPDPDTFSLLDNDRLERSLSFLVEAARRIDREIDVISAIKDGIVGDTSSSDIRMRFDSVRGTPPPNVKSEVDGFVSAAGRKWKDEVDALINSALESLSICRKGVETEREIKRLYDAGKYSDRLLGLMIPIPSSPLLSPGNTLTVRAPRRTLGEKARGVMRSSLFGINANIMLSKPVMGVLKSIKLATITHALLPVMRVAAKDLSSGTFIGEPIEPPGFSFADRIWRVVGRQVTPIGATQQRTGRMEPGERREIQRICEEQILAIFVDPLVKGVDDADTTKKMFDAYKKSAAALSSSKISYIRPETGPDASKEELVEQAAVELLHTLIDGTCAELLQRRVLSKIYEVAPCTAVLLNPRVFTEQQRFLFNVLVPPADKALETMTSGLYNELIGAGIQKGKETKPDFLSTFISRSADRIAASIKVIYEFYGELKAEVDASGTGPAKAVIKRVSLHLRRRGSRDQDDIEKLAAAFNVPGARKMSDLVPAAEAVYRKIEKEMQVLGDAGEEAPLPTIISEAVKQRAGSSPASILANMDAEDEYAAYLEAAGNFIGSMDLTFEDADKVMRDNVPAAIEFGTDQLVHEIAGRASSNLLEKYRADNTNAARRIKQW